MKKLVYSLSLIALLACEKEIDFEIPDPGKKAVIETRLQYGETINLYLSESVYSLSAENPAYRDDFEAYLYTSEPGSPFPFEVIENPDFGPEYIYQLNHSLNQGQNYRIVVRADGIPRASAEERLLEVVEIEDFNYNREDKEFTFRFRDDAATEDYYMVTINELGSDNLIFSTLDLNMEFFGYSDFFEDGEFDGRQFGFEAYLPDESFNGKSREVKVRLEQPTEAVFIELRLHHISKSYYRHELTKSAYETSDGFFSEPVQIFSNVENGYGIMATSASDIEKVQYWGVRC